MAGLEKIIGEIHAESDGLIREVLDRAQKEAAQKDERSAPILIKTKHRVVDTFAELLKNWGTALICEILR